MGASEAALLEALPAALLSKKDDSVISQGLGLLNDDLTFAEDLILVSNDIQNLQNFCLSISSFLMYLRHFLSCTVPRRGDQPPMGQLRRSKDFVGV